MKNNSLDCTNANAKIVKRYFDDGFAVRIPISRFAPFFEWYMKITDSENVKHEGWKETPDTITIKKIN